MRLLIIWTLYLDRNLNAPSELKILEEIAKKGHHVVCIFPATGNFERPRYVSIMPIQMRRLIPLFSYLAFCLRSASYLTRTYRTFDVIVLNVYTFPLALPLILAKRFLGIGKDTKFVVREASPPVEVRLTHRYYQMLGRNLILHLARLSDCTFAISPMHAQEIAAKFGLRKVRVWSTAVDTSIFDPRRYTASRELIRDDLSLAGKFVLIYHGVLSHGRGLYELLRAIVLVREQAPEVVLLMLGTGDAEPRLRAVANDFNLHGNVVFLGKVNYDEVPRFLVAVDAGVLPLPIQGEWAYQTPIKLIECLAMEKPVILTETESHKWIIGKKGHAYFCGAGTPEELAKAILECRAHTISTMRDEIIARFSSKSVAREVLVVLSQNVRGRQPLLKGQVREKT